MARMWRREKRNQSIPCNSNEFLRQNISILAKLYLNNLYNMFFTRNILKWRTETNDRCGIQVKIFRMEMPTMRPTVNEGPIWVADCEYDQWWAWLWAFGWVWVSYCEYELMTWVWQCHTWYILVGIGNDEGLIWSTRTQRRNNNNAHHKCITWLMCMHTFVQTRAFAWGGVLSIYKLGLFVSLLYQLFPSHRYIATYLI